MRDFVKNISLKTIVVMLGIWLILSPVTACTVSESSLKTDAKAVAAALNSIATVVASSDATLATSLQTAATSIESAASSYSGATLLSALNSAAAAAEVILAAIPATASYASLVSIAVVALDVILANTTTSSTTVKAAHLTVVAESNLAKLRTMGAEKVRYRAMKSPNGQKTQFIRPNDLKSAWNQQCKTLGYNSCLMK